MSFSVAKQGDTVVIGIEGHLVVGNRQALKQLVLDELARGERSFRVDFGRTRYVDSSGLGVLVAMAKKVKQERGTLRLSNLDGDLRTLFELTKLATLFQYEEEPGAASPSPSGAPGALPPSPRLGSDLPPREETSAP